jgi:hypothetical protein
MLTLGAVMLPRRRAVSLTITDFSACRSPVTVPSTTIIWARTFAVTVPSAHTVTRCEWVIEPSMRPLMSSSSSACSSPLKCSVGPSTDTRSDELSYGLDIVSTPPDK